MLLTEHFSTQLPHKHIFHYFLHRNANKALLPQRSQTPTERMANDIELFQTMQSATTIWMCAIKGLVTLLSALNRYRTSAKHTQVPVPLHRRGHAGRWSVWCGAGGPFSPLVGRVVQLELRPGWLTHTLTHKLGALQVARVSFSRWLWGELSAGCPEHSVWLT